MEFIYIISLTLTFSLAISTKSLLTTASPLNGLNDPEPSLLFRELTASNLTYQTLIDEAIGAVNKVNGSVYRKEKAILFVRNSNVPDASINKVKLHVEETNCTVTVGLERGAYNNCVAVENGKVFECIADITYSIAILNGVPYFNPTADCKQVAGPTDEVHTLPHVTGAAVTKRSAINGTNVVHHCGGEAEHLRPWTEELQAKRIKELQERREASTTTTTTTTTMMPSSSDSSAVESTTTPQSTTESAAEVTTARTLSKRAVLEEGPADKSSGNRDKIPSPPTH